MTECVSSPPVIRCMRYENAPRGRRVPVASPARLMAARQMPDIKTRRKNVSPPTRGFNAMIWNRPPVPLAALWALKASSSLRAAFAEGSSNPERSAATTRDQDRSLRNAPASRRRQPDGDSRHRSHALITHTSVDRSKGAFFFLVGRSTRAARRSGG